MVKSAWLQDRHIKQGRKSVIVIHNALSNGYCSTDKSYARDNRLIFLRVLIAGIVWHLDVGSSYPGYVGRSKGTSVRRLKRYVSWV